MPPRKRPAASKGKEDGEGRQAKRTKREEEEVEAKEAEDDKSRQTKTKGKLTFVKASTVRVTSSSSSSSSTAVVTTKEAGRYPLRRSSGPFLHFRSFINYLIMFFFEYLFICMYFFASRSSPGGVCAAAVVATPVGTEGRGQPSRGSQFPLLLQRSVHHDHRRLLLRARSFFLVMDITHTSFSCALCRIRDAGAAVASIW